MTHSLRTFITQPHVVFFLIGILVVFGLDCVLPQEINIEILYIPLLFICVRSTNQLFPTLAAVLVSLFIGIATVLNVDIVKENSVPIHSVIINKLAILTAVWISYYLVRVMQRSNGHYQAIWRQNSTGLLLVDQKGDIIQVSPAIHQFFGYSEDDLIGKKIETLIPQRFQHNHLQHRSQFNANPHPRSMGVGLDLFGRKKDGTEFPVEISLSPFQTEAGRFVIVFVIDNTIRKTQEDTLIAQKKELGALTQALKTSNKELETRVQERTHSLQQVVNELEKQVQQTSAAQKKADDIQFLLKQMLTEYQVGTVTVVDRSFNCVFAGGIDYKLPTDTLIGKPIYHYLPDSYRQVMMQQLLPVFEGTRLLNFEPDWDIDDVTPSFDAFPILDLSGAIEHVVVFTRNVKERKQMEHEIQKALEKERELNELKSSFVSMASHEFRTPLTSISSSADLIALYADRSETEKIKKHSERIKHSVENLNNILGEFLSLGKLEEGKTTAQLRDMNLPELVEDIHEELKYAFKTGQKLECHHEGEQIVQLDSNLLKNVLLNLVSNAIKYAPENTNIQLFSVVGNGKTTIKIQDKGIGISPEDQQKLFGRFFRASNASDVQGTGLGLYIVKNYVEMMGGKVTCESELGKGSTFWVEFISK